MQTKLLAAISLICTSAALAAEPMWFVSVYGENMQLISAASGNTNVKDGVFLDADYIGTEIYVRTVKGYELDGFRPYESTNSDTASDSISEAADSAASASDAKTTPTSEFGPLTDSGVQYFQNDDYFGWFCSELFVKPVGDNVYRLRCGTKMRHDN